MFLMDKFVDVEMESDLIIDVWEVVDVIKDVVK